MGKKLLVLGFSLSGLLVVVGISGIFLSDNLIKSLVTSVYDI
jgi:NADH:ubiquinone oxidoreductase subunit K